MGFPQRSSTWSKVFLFQSQSMIDFLLFPLHCIVFRRTRTIRNDHLGLFSLVLVHQQKLIWKWMKRNILLKRSLLLHLLDRFHQQRVISSVGERPINNVLWRNSVPMHVDKVLCTKSSNGLLKDLNKTRTNVLSIVSQREIIRSEHMRVLKQQ